MNLKYLNLTSEYAEVAMEEVLGFKKGDNKTSYEVLKRVIDERTGRIVMMGALDNLVKGAAGQAVQNMNLLFGLDEAEGLKMVPMFP